MSFAVSKAGRKSSRQVGVNVTPILNLFMILIPALLTSFQIVQTAILNLELAGMGAVEGEQLLSPPPYFMTIVMAKTSDDRMVCEFSRYQHIQGESIVVDTLIPKTQLFNSWDQIDSQLAGKMESLHNLATEEVRSFLDTVPDEMLMSNWREIKRVIAENPDQQILDSIVSRMNIFVLVSVDSIGDQVSGERVTLNDLVKFMRIARRNGFINNYLQPPPWWPGGM
ncbi:MAG: hypothetical protein ACP5FK_02970 [bacterium]